MTHNLLTICLHIELQMLLIFFKRQLLYQHSMSLIILEKLSSKQETLSLISFSDLLHNNPNIKKSQSFEKIKRQNLKQLKLLMKKKKLFPLKILIILLFEILRKYLKRTTQFKIMIIFLNQICLKQTIDFLERLSR